MEQWTDERRTYYAELIKARKPWEKSTGPKTDKGKNKVSRNAVSTERCLVKKIYDALQIL